MAEHEPVQLSLIDVDDGRPASGGQGSAGPAPIVDQSVRDRIAGELDHTLFVEAGAGSGKTRALVDRVEALVQTGTAIEQIAAITFTEKAAAELRDRIRQRFEQRAAGGDESERFAIALEQLDGAAVGTLHSFAQRLLSEHPVEAGLPPAVEVLDEIGSQMEFEARWVDFVDRLLADDSVGRSLLLLETTRVRVNHLRTLALALGANWDLVEERLDLDHPDPPRLEVGPVLEHVAALSALAGHCRDHEDRLWRRLGDLTDLAATLDDTADEIDRLQLVDELSKQAKVDRVGRKDNWAGHVDEVRDAARPLQQLCEQMATNTIQHALHRVLSALGRFTLDAAEARRSEGRLEFHDLLVRARRLLRDPEVGPRVRASLRDRYPRLLIDEFQDTDPIQIDLAILLASPADDAAGRSWVDVPVDDGRLFFVGDPKQSIYRFRRADIAVYLQARDRFVNRLELVQNFRSVEPLVGWINHVFTSLIRFEERSQPDYVPLVAHRTEPPPEGPAVAVLGADPVDAPDAEALRRTEAGLIAAAVAETLRDRWSVHDGRSGDWRGARPGDVCILLPARTNLPALERALDVHGVPYRAETSSLVYTTREVRDCLIALRAVSDPTDELATLAALRSALYGCGDDDLAHWRLVVRGRFSIHTGVPDDAPADHPVAEGLGHLARLHEARLWSTPSQLLDRLVRERGVLESAVAAPRPRDVWRRLRFVIDQARAWADAGGTGLRAYLDWAHLQGADNARVTETVLPETDDDSVRILTVHGAKGLEFPIVFLAGMTTELRRAASGPTIAFPPDSDPVARVRSGVQSEGYERWQPIDEQMDRHERVRLLYVAATRARDHLVVSLVRNDSGRTTGALSLFEADAAGAGATVLHPATTRLPAADQPDGPTPLDRDEWRTERERALSRASERQVIAATTLAREATGADDPGLAKRERDLELPPWNKGRYGTAVGRAVHGVLQVIDLATGDGLADAVAAQAAAEGVGSRSEIVARLVESALATEVARSASRAEHWRELYVAAPVGSRLVEGYIDLAYRSAGDLVVVDWKTDHLDGDDDLDAKLERYRLQGASYVAALEAATGASVSSMVFAFLSPDGATEVDLPDLAQAVAEVRGLAGTGALDDLVVDTAELDLV